MDLTINYPFWWIIICIITGLLFSIVLYYNDNSSGFKRWHKAVLGFFRFFVVSILCFLLLSPILKSFYQYSEKPLLLFAVDNSASMTFAQDSTAFVREMNLLIDEMDLDLSDKFEVQKISFAENCDLADHFSFDEKLSNTDPLFDKVSSLYDHRKIQLLNG